MYHSLFIHSANEGHFDCFWVLAIMNKDAVNKDVGFCVDRRFQVIWVNTKECVIAGSYGESMWSFVKNHQAVFHSGFIILHSWQLWLRVPVALHPHQHLLLSEFWILTILIGV